MALPDVFEGGAHVEAHNDERHLLNSVLGAIGVSAITSATINSGHLIFTRADTSQFDVGSVLGPQGIQGVKGDKGDQGIQGLTGNDGPQGIQGIKGDQGATGIQGTQGIQGVKGDKGDKGDQGIQGIQGIPGVKGDQGDQGIQGIQGETGPQGPAATPAPSNTQTGTTYTLAITDAEGVVEMNNAAANTLTVPLNSVVAFPVGTRIEINQRGAGKTTIAPAAGVTIHTAASYTTRTQYSSVVIRKSGTDEWCLSGDMT